MRISDRFSETARCVQPPRRRSAGRWFTGTACLVISVTFLLAGAATYAGEVVVSSENAAKESATAQRVRVAKPLQGKPAEGASKVASRVVQCAYSTGKAGHRLKWRRLQTGNGGPSAELAQYNEPITPPAQLTAPVDPFDDPFEDSKRAGTSGTEATEAAQRGGQVPQATSPLLPAEDAARILATEPADRSPDQSTEKAPDQLDQHIGERALEEALAAGPSVPTDTCPVPGTLENPLPAGMKSIDQLGHQIATGKGRLPTDCPISKQVVSSPATRGWPPLTFTWKASALCHKPAYFEQVHLERYGHSLGPYLQPIVSGAHFFLTVPVLPYKMGLYPPNECLYTLGYYRPGNCAPYMLDPLPISLRAALYEAGAVTGAVFVLP